MVKLFKISPSNIHKIMAGAVGLTEIQKVKLIELDQRKIGIGKPLTPNMEQELIGLEYKRDNPSLPTGTITYLEEWFISKKYNRKREWFNKFVEKGLAVEQSAIDMLSFQIGDGVALEKNTEYFFNDFIHGYPDVVYEDKVYDTKSAWDVFTFPFFDKRMDDKYEWQLHGYMAITGKPKAELVYCLIDTPQPLIDLELKKLYFQSGGKAEDWNPETYEHLSVNYKFNDIPFEEKIKIFPLERSEDKISQIVERVQLCRKYINENLERK